MKSLIVSKVDIPWFRWHSGKVRDWTIVDAYKGQRVIVTTDRLSAFDSVLPTIIPMKGIVLNRVSNFWKRYFAGIIPSDLISSNSRDYLPLLRFPESEWAERLKWRTAVIQVATVVPIECVVRGYVAGSFWSEYLKIRGENSTNQKIQVLGCEVSGNFRESDQLPQPIFTPATKALTGHDENLSYPAMVNHLQLWILKHPKIQKLTSAKLLAQNIKSTSLLIYMLGAEYARRHSLIVADTKLEFGFIDGKLALIDEVLTPDSSRFWNLLKYKPGEPQEFLDKQPVRDYLIASGWNKEPPAPEIPKKIVRQTVKRYREVEKRLLGKQNELI